MLVDALHVRGAPAVTAANHADPDAIVGSNRAGPLRGGESGAGKGEPGSKGRGSFDKIASTEGRSGDLGFHKTAKIDSECNSSGPFYR